MNSASITTRKGNRNKKLLSKCYGTLLLKNSTIVEVVKSHLAPQRALDLLVVCLTTRNPRDYINKAGGECGNRTRHLGRWVDQLSHSPKGKQNIWTIMRRILLYKYLIVVLRRKLQLLRFKITQRKHYNERKNTSNKCQETRKMSNNLPVITIGMQSWKHQAQYLTSNNAQKVIFVYQQNQCKDDHGTNICHQSRMGGRGLPMDAREGYSAWG